MAELGADHGAVGHQEDEVLRALHRRAAVTAAELASHSGLADCEEALESLVARGLVDHDPAAGTYTPVAPFAALGQLLTEAADQLAAAQAGITALRLRLPERAPVVPPTHDVEHVPPEAGPQERVFSMVARARHDFAFVSHGGSATNRDREHSSEGELLERGVRVRGLYQRAAVDVPGGLEDLLWSLSRGEEARVTVAVPTKWLMIDAEVVLLPHRPGGEFRHGLLVVRQPTLVATFAAYFETLWSGAVPLETLPAEADLAGADFGPDDRVLARLMATGLTDKAIGRQLGVSERTAHRRVSELLARLDADTRFQAGVQAVRRGLLTVGGEIPKAETAS